jgi:hypothetical protein
LVGQASRDPERLAERIAGHKPLRQPSRKPAIPHKPLDLAPLGHGEDTGSEQCAQHVR